MQAHVALLSCNTALHATIQLACMHTVQARIGFHAAVGARCCWCAPELTLLLTSPICNLYRIVVLPAASRPSITTRISLLPNKESNRRVNVCPILPLLLLGYLPGTTACAVGACLVSAAGGCCYWGASSNARCSLEPAARSPALKQLQGRQEPLPNAVLLC